MGLKLNTKRNFKCILSRNFKTLSYQDTPPIKDVQRARNEGIEIGRRKMKFFLIKHLICNDLEKLFKENFDINFMRAGI
jgi:hypothetical protein